MKPPPTSFAKHWRIDPDIVYLNHGSFGATPVRVLQAQSALRDLMESELVRFIAVELPDRLDVVRKRLGSFLHCNGRDLVFVPNATTAVQTVLNNTDLGPGDELLVTNHEYPATLNQFAETSRKTGASLVVATIPWPIEDPAAAIDAVLTRVTDRTRLVLLSHVTSPTGLVLPVQQIVDALNDRSIDSLVDGAHAPGSVEFDLSKLNPTYYTANCHKWICSPKGSAFLYVRRDRQPGFRPTVLSVHAHKDELSRERFHVEFDYVGTNDYTAALCIPDAIDTMQDIAEWPRIIATNRATVLEGRTAVCRTLGIEPPAPESMLAAIATVILPPHNADLDARLAARPTAYDDALQDALLERWSIQVPIWRFADLRMIRISAQLYNSPEQYDYLARALAEELERERTMR